jgi:opacity protein-like surface antigen
MKTRRWVTACAAALLALTCSAAVAQKQKDQNRGQSQRTENRGQTKKRYRQFNAKQRQYATTYYNQNRNHEIFRPDRRWNNDYENRLQPGYVLDNDMRGMSRPAPIEMTRGFGPAPRGYRYVVIGGNVVLIDDGYRVHDAIRFSINIGL